MRAINKNPTAKVRRSENSKLWSMWQQQYALLSEEQKAALQERDREELAANQRYERYTIPIGLPIGDNDRQDEDEMC